MNREERQAFFRKNIDDVASMFSKLVAGCYDQTDFYMYEIDWTTWKYQCEKNGVSHLKDLPRKAYELNIPKEEKQDLEAYLRYLLFGTDKKLTLNNFL